MRKFFIRLIDFYQVFLSFDRGLLSVFAPDGACRFEISCSEYTKQAITKYGIAKGLSLGIKRLLLCNPFFEPKIGDGRFGNVTVLKGGGR